MNNFVAGGPNIPQAGGNGGGFGRSLAAMALGFMGTRNRMLEDQQRNINDLALHMAKRETTDAADKEMGNHWISAAVHANKTFSDAGMPGIESLNAGGIRVQTAYKGNEKRTPTEGESPTPVKPNGGGQDGKPDTTDSAPKNSTESPQPVKAKKERNASFSEASAAVRGEHITPTDALEISPTYAKKYAAFHAENDMRVAAGQKPRKSKNFSTVNQNLNGNSDSNNGNKG